MPSATIPRSQILRVGPKFELINPPPCHPSAQIARRGRMKVGEILGQPTCVKPPQSHLPVVSCLCMMHIAGRAGWGRIKALSGRHPEAAADFHPAPPFAYCCPILTRHNRYEGSSTYISIDRFLKLMLGVAVTCSNKQTFIDKIQVTPAPFRWLLSANEDGWHC